MKQIIILVFLSFQLGLAQNQDINLIGNGNDIYNGGTNSPDINNNTNFGDIVLLSASEITFTLENTHSGGSPRNNKLSVSDIILSGSNASEFVVSGISLPKSINRNSSSTFKITFTPTTLGSKTALISILSDDPDENPYTFNIKGTGVDVGNEPSLTLLNTHPLTVLEPSGLAFNRATNELFTVSDNTGFVYRISNTGTTLQTLNYVGSDLEGVSMYTTNKILIAVEGSRELIEYDYVVDNSASFTSHVMNYTNTDLSATGDNSRIEGVTYDDANNEIYFLNEKNPGALIKADGSFNVINEYPDPLAHGGDYSGSAYVKETGELWLASDQNSTIYKCNTNGTIIQSFPVTTSGGNPINKLEGIAIDYNNQLLYAVSDGGQELYIFKINDPGGSTDTEAPTTPTNLSASNTTYNSTDLLWDASTDNIGVTGYDVYQDGAFVTNVLGAAYQATGLSSNTTYAFYVIARDAAGNSSSVSNTVNVTTDIFIDIEAPTAPTGLLASNTTDSSTDLSWNASSDNIGVTGYDVYQDGAFVMNVSGTSYQVSDLSESTTYAFYVIARDAAGNLSSLSSTINETTTATPTCSDGIQNGDETGVDCGGSTCEPCPPGNVVLHQGYFETGWDNWADGGSDCALYSGSRSYEGSYSIRLRDNSGTASAMTLSNIDVSPYSQVEVDFYFYVYSMENNEDFWLRYYNGTSWTTVSSYTSGIDMNNNTFYNATVTLDSNQYSFVSNAGFRFQNDASAKNDYIYVDQVTITGINGAAARNQGDKLTIVGKLYPVLSNIKLFPNPVNGNILNIELLEEKLFTYKVFNVAGQIILKGNSKGSINVQELNSGMYYIEINTLDEVITKKFIKQ